MVDRPRRGREVMKRRSGPTDSFIRETFSVHGFGILCHGQRGRKRPLGRAALGISSSVGRLAERNRALPMRLTVEVAPLTDSRHPTPSPLNSRTVAGLSHGQPAHARERSATIAGGTGSKRIHSAFRPVCPWHRSPDLQRSQLYDRPSTPADERSPQVVSSEGHSFGVTFPESCAMGSAAGNDFGCTQY